MDARKQRVFQISPEQWMHSAAQVTTQGEGLAVGHLSSDYRMQAAQFGWQGASAMALKRQDGRLVGRVEGAADQDR